MLIKTPNPRSSPIPEPLNEEAVREIPDQFELQDDYYPARDLNITARSEGRPRHLPDEVRSSYLITDQAQAKDDYRKEKNQTLIRQRAKNTLRRKVKYGEAFRLD